MTTIIQLVDQCKEDLNIFWKKIMNDKPDFEKWAKQIMECSDDSKWLEMHISEELRKCWEAGYRYAVRNDWWQAQECNHKWNPNLDYMYCSKCGETG